MLIVVSSWTYFSNHFQSDKEMDFVARIYLTLRSSCVALVPLLANMLVIPILILIVEKFTEGLSKQEQSIKKGDLKKEISVLVSDKHHYQQFLDTNISLLRDHF